MRWGGARARVRMRGNRTVDPLRDAEARAREIDNALRLRDAGLLDDQAQLLDQVFAAIVEHRVDVLIIAGDLFDRAVPRKEAVQLFNDFLARVYAETGAAIVAIAAT